MMSFVIIAKAKEFQDFSMVSNSYVIKSIVETLKKISLNDCMKRCFNLLSCHSLNFNQNSQECQLSDKDSKTNQLIKTNDWTHFQSDPYLEHQGKYCLSVKPCKIYEYCKSTESPPYFKCFEKPCENFGKYTLSNNEWKCKCKPYTFGKFCEYIQLMNFTK